MSEAKIAELLRRAQALEEKIDTAVIKPLRLGNTGKKSVTKHKLKLNKKGTIKYFENKATQPTKNVSAKPKKTKLFASIQFSSSSDEDQSVPVSSSHNVPSSNLVESVSSITHSSVNHSSSPGCSTSFVPDSCPNEDEQSIYNNIASRNVSELVCDVDVSTVGNSFGLESSELAAGASNSSSNLMMIPVTTSNTSAFTKDESSSMRQNDEQQRESFFDYKNVSSSQSASCNVDDSIVVLSNRLENIFSKKAKNAKTKKSLSQSSCSQSMVSTLGISTSLSSQCNLAKERSGKMKFVNAISFFSDEETASSPDVKKSIVKHENKLINHTEGSSSMSDVTNGSRTSSQIQSAPDEILCLTERLNRILLAPSTNKKKSAQKSKPKRRPKMLAMADIFDSHSSSSHEELASNDKISNDVGVNLQSASADRKSSIDSASTSLSTPEKQNISLQVSLSSVSDEELFSNVQIKSNRDEQNVSDGSGCVMTDKSLQCSFDSEHGNSINDPQPRTEISKCLQVSINSSCSSKDGELSSAVMGSSDYEANKECSFGIQPAVANVSLQVSVPSLDASLDFKHNMELSHNMSRNSNREISAILDDADSTGCDDVLYKTAIEKDTSCPLYKTVSEYAPGVSPVHALFQDQNRYASIAGNQEKESSQQIINNADAHRDLQNSASKNITHQQVCVWSSSESEEKSSPVLTDSTSQPENAQNSCSRTLATRGNCCPGRINRNESIGPDQNYEGSYCDDNDVDDIIISQSHCESTDSSSEDELETFFQKMKKPEKPKKTPDIADFIVADDELSSEDEADVLFYIQANRVLSSESRKSLKPKSLALCHKEHSPSDSSDFTDHGSEDKENTPNVRPVKSTGLTCKPKQKRAVLTHIDAMTTPVRKPTQQQHDNVKKKSFLSSLSADCNHCERDLDAIKYIKNFRKHREELTCTLFKLYNETVFSNTLPSDLLINWNTRMYKTAGYCVYKKNKSNTRTAKVELSVKVCDSAERVRDTLIHELCHAAVWLLHGKLDGHGPLWKHWAYKANLVHPELPVISRCHNYKIKTKYTYKCTKCGYQIGRHSKSLDIASKVCGYCMSPFELISNLKTRTQTPNRFAQFVKSNYGTAKKQGQLTHQEVMKKLAADFSSKIN